MKNKKTMISSIVLIMSIAFIAVFSFNKLRYPSLPISSITPTEAIEQLNKSEQKLVEISNEHDAIWYMIKNTNDVNKSIEDLINKEGWTLKELDGNSLFFNKEDETLIVSTKMWTKKYRLVKVPVEFMGG